MTRSRSWEAGFQSKGTRPARRPTGPAVTIPDVGEARTLSPHRQRDGGTHSLVRAGTRISRLPAEKARAEV